MITQEGLRLNPDSPLPEHPAPQFQRASYFSLNGRWEFSISRSKTSIENYDTNIIVPFSVETPLSGIQQRISRLDYLHYRKRFLLPEGFANSKILLHFEAVDQIADVYLNNQHLCHHEGGYLPFQIELPCLPKENELVVVVRDDTSSNIYPRGKQSENSKGIWYTPTSGIWGSVWMEAVPEKRVRCLKLTPDFDGKRIHLEIDYEGDCVDAYAEISYEGQKLGEARFNDEGNASFDLSNDFHPWSPSSPCLYDLKLHAGEDEVSSYFGMRKFGKTILNGRSVFALNNEPFLLKGVLDQGYFPDGGLTPPSDIAMLNDILLAKKMGFNLIRKHIKIEPMRWYYRCDHEGMLVMQDFVNNGYPYKPLLIALAPFFGFRFKDTGKKDHSRFGQKDPASRLFFETQIPQIPGHLYNVVSLCSYVIFNEGWGQFDAERLTGLLRDVDSTRLIDSHSGWYDQGCGDFSGNHIYFRPIKMKNDGERILNLSEFGGYSQRAEGHCFSEKNFGYKVYRDKGSLSRGIAALFKKQLGPQIKKETISCYVFTQLTDVEQETNGLITYDREINKVDPELMNLLNEEMKW